MSAVRETCSELAVPPHHTRQIFSVLVPPRRDEEAGLRRAAGASGAAREATESVWGAEKAGGGQRSQFADWLVPLGLDGHG
jgi:hypothetical protein